MLRISNHHVSKIISILFLVEVLILIGSVFLGSSIRFRDMPLDFTGQSTSC